MDSNRNWNDIGNELRSAVKHTMQTGDFSGFSSAVSDTVSGVVDEAKRQAGEMKDSLKMQNRQSGPSRTPDFRSGRNAYAYRQGQWNRSGSQAPRTGQTMDGKSTRTPQMQNGFQPPKTVFHRKGDVSSVLLTVFGGIGTALTSIGLLVFGMLGLLFLRPPARIAGVIVIGLLLGGSIALIAKGVLARNRLARAERYLALCRNHDYINLSELASQTGKSCGFVRRDVKKMLRIGMFPQGHLDKQENCLMLSDETYREYLAIEQQRSSYELEEFSRQQRQSVPEENIDERQIWRSLSGIEEPGDALCKENPKLAEMIRQGQECTGHIRQMNEQIRGKVISDKLYALEHVLKEIFNRVREHPEQMPKMQKFMDYYLPTTLKLVEAYEEFDSVPSPNAEILQAKSELEQTLDTINDSFAELLNQLYQSTVMDATTDAKVLQTMLAKDGLAKDHAFDAR